MRWVTANPPNILTQVSAMPATASPRIHASGRSPALAAMDDMPRYAAALFLRDLGLPPDLLGDVAARLVTRPRDDLDELPGPNTNDTVLQHVLAEPMALPHFLLRTAPHHASAATICAPAGQSGLRPAVGGPSSSRRVPRR